MLLFLNNLIDMFCEEKTNSTMLEQPHRLASV